MSCNINSKIEKKNIGIPITGDSNYQTVQYAVETAEKTKYGVSCKIYTVNERFHIKITLFLSI